MNAQLGFDSCWEQRFWSSPPYFNWFQGSLPTVHLVTGAVSLGFKWIGHERRQLFPSGADGNMLNYTSTL